MRFGQSQNRSMQKYLETSSKYSVLVQYEARSVPHYGGRLKLRCDFSFVVMGVGHGKPVLMSIQAWRLS